MLRSRHHYVAWSQSSPAAVTAVILLLVASLTGHGQAVVASRSRRLARQVIVSRHNGHGTGYGLQQQPDSNQVHAVAYLGFCEGGPEPKTRGSRRRRRQWGGVWGGGVPSPLKKFKKKIWFNVLKKFLCSGQRGGGIAQCPPLNTPLLPYETLTSAKQAINDKLQGSVTAYLRRGGIFNTHLTANLPKNLQ